MFDYSIAFFIATGIGLIASIIGMGGGFLYVPTLSMIFNVDQRTAIGTSLAIMIFAACSATLCYHRQKKLLISAAFVMAIPSMIFAVLGSVVTVYVDSRALALLVALALFITAIQMFLPTYLFIQKITRGPSFITDIEGTDEDGTSVRIPYSHLIVWGALGGLISGTTGISGGVLFVPALIAIGVPVHFAVATSLLATIPPSITGAATHAVLGDISLPFLIIYGTGAGIGAYIGASVAPRIHAEHIRKFFGVLLLLIALLMIRQKVLGG